MKFLFIPIAAAILSGCAVYPDAPSTAYPSTAVYGSYYSGYPYYDYPYGYYYPPYPYRYHDHDRYRDGRERAKPAPDRDSSAEDQRKRELANRLRRRDDERDGRSSWTERREGSDRSSLPRAFRDRLRDR